MAQKLLLTIKEAAEALSISEKTVRKLIDEADTDKRSSWKHGREMINLTPRKSSYRVLRINAAAIVPQV